MNNTYIHRTSNTTVLTSDITHTNTLKAVYPNMDSIC